MCGLDPVTTMLASAAVSSIGSMVSGAEQNRVARQQAAASQGAAIAEQGRQAGFRDEARQSFSSLLQGLGPQQQTAALQDLGDSRSAALTGAARGFAPGGVPLLDSAGGGVRYGIDAAAGKRVGEAKQDAATVARLGAFDDLNTANARKIQGTQTDLAHIADKAGGSAGLLPTDQNAAVSNVRPASGLGDLVTGIGKLGVAYGATRPGLPVKPPATRWDTAMQSRP